MHKLMFCTFIYINVGFLCLVVWVMNACRMHRWMAGQQSDGTLLMSNKNVKLSVCLPFVTACMNDPAVFLALHLLLMHSILV